MNKNSQAPNLREKLAAHNFFSRSVRCLPVGSNGEFHSLSTASVRVWTERLSLPTYLPKAPDRNPMFFENRVYQGSSGRIYPNPLIEAISHEPVERIWQAVHLENDYLDVVVLPELGGRIYAARDKIARYDFFYRQDAIKPALVGLFGPWISGGVEFNWPQHHRPSTFRPVDWLIEKDDDGSTTLWLSEHDPMERMKGMLGLCLYPGRSVVEARVQLYNRTPIPRTFLWWANAAVHVHDDYEVFFPPDVRYVADHARRAISEFPIARGSYYGVDYSSGADLRWPRNILVPTSYMVLDSRHNFFGGYDHRRHAGFVHYANHYISPGKKLFTWGNHNCGHAWNRNLTDRNDAYVELMAGVFTDNQPDFSWLQPYETKRFRHHWYPIQAIGPVSQATLQMAVSLRLSGTMLRIGVCATELFKHAVVRLAVRGRRLNEFRVELAPSKPFVRDVTVPRGTAKHQLQLSVWSGDGKRLISCSPEKPGSTPAPTSATEPPLPIEIRNNEELYLTGLHLEQYRHATRRPELYWFEAFRRDPGDARINQALGLWNLQRGELIAAEKHLRRAIATLTFRNPNPRDGEAYYLLGLALKYQGHVDKSYAAFYKATWNQAWQSAGFHALAELDCSRAEFAQALEHLDAALLMNPLDTKARNLKAVVLQRLDHHGEAEETARQTVKLDPLDPWARHELARSLYSSRRRMEARRCLDEMLQLMRRDIQTALDIALDHANAGLWKEAVEWIAHFLPTHGWNVISPMLYYCLGWCHQHLGNVKQTAAAFRRGSLASPDYCFPSRLEEMLILEAAIARNPSDAKAHYYLGNLLYDRKRGAEAIHHWRVSARLDPSFTTVHRNLGLAWFNIRHDPVRAKREYLRAFKMDPRDGRILFELDQLRKRLNDPPQKRLAFLEKHLDLVGARDDLSLERVTLHNLLGQPRKALAILGRRQFRPWEGGEGLAPAQYEAAHLILGQEFLQRGDPSPAIAHFSEALNCPKNLGEARRITNPQTQVQYHLGQAWMQYGDHSCARNWFSKAAATSVPFSEAACYRAFALRKLGQEKKAKKVFRRLLRHAREEAGRSATTPYFATSLPNFLVFEDNPALRNRIECNYLEGLARLGLGSKTAAQRLFKSVLALDINHLGAQQQLGWMEKVCRTTLVS